MLTDLAAVLRAAGCAVAEVPGWQSCGHAPLATAALRTIVVHDTAGPSVGEAPSLGVVRNGRPDLAGPLAHFVLGRGGTWYVVAAGLCWHAGAVLQDWQANEHSIGVEVEGDGRAPFTAAQQAALVRGVRALAAHYGIPATRVLGHREVCSPPGRKVDPSPFDMAALRAAVAAPLEDDMQPGDVWTAPVVNFHGDTVEARQVLDGIEQRLDSLQAAVAALTATVGQVAAQVKPDRAT